MRTTVTQKDGSFRLGNIEAHDSAPPAQNGVGGSRLEPGPHRRRLSVAKSGYGVTEVDIDPAWESGTPVDLILTKAGRVEGRVTSREGPVEGAQVAAWPRYVMASDENGREALATSTTDSAGQFALDGLPCFAVVIEVQAPGFAALRYEDAAPTPEGTKVQISLQRLPSLRGAVRSELTGAAVTRFRLWAWAEDFEDDTLKAACGSRSKTERLIEDPGGRFELADLCLGAEYKLLIRAQGYAPFDLGVRPLLDQSIALDIVLAEGETLEAVVIDRGTGAPIRDAAICIVPTAGSGIDEPVRFTSGSDGVASVRNLRAGEYMARIEHADYVETKPRSISVEAGGSLVRWALSPGGAVRMRLGLPGDFGLLRATGSPFRAQVRFKRSTALEGGAEADCPTEVVLDLAGLGANPGQLESAADEVLLERESMAPGEYEVYFEDHSANAKAEAAPRVTFLGTVRVDAGSTTDCTFQVPH
jgi:5-hydroxyisourate hydrolase-like protein (transthyretin family)